MAKIGPKEQRAREMRTTATTGRVEVGDIVTYPDGGSGKIVAGTVSSKTIRETGSLSARVNLDAETAKKRIAEIQKDSSSIITGKELEDRLAETQQETEVKTTKKKPAGKKPSAKPARKPVGAPPARAAKEGGIRPGSKLDLVADLLKRKEGCTAAEALAITGWPALSFNQIAKSARLRLRKEKQGKITRYWAV